jgi:hypothetical protein
MLPNDNNGQPPQPPLVSILRQGSYLIASIHSALDDRQLTGSSTTSSNGSARTTATASSSISP